MHVNHQIKRRCFSWHGQVRKEEEEKRERERERERERKKRERETKRGSYRRRSRGTPSAPLLRVGMSHPQFTAHHNTASFGWVITMFVYLGPRSGEKLMKSHII